MVVGYVELHGRPETESLLDGLEILPPQRLEHRGLILAEFDLDAALARRPQLLLVDELAHSNHPGARHPKRWQDVEELLGAGIDVYTTLNVQHLESLNDIVAQITGVEVRETVPDSVFASASDVELVDLPPDELIERLAEGKVYVADKARQAHGGFFPQGQPHRLASARAACDGRPRRCGHARIPRPPRDRAALGCRRTPTGLRRTRSVVGAAGAFGAAHGDGAATHNGWQCMWRRRHSPTCRRRRAIRSCKP